MCVFVCIFVISELPYLINFDINHYHIITLQYKIKVFDCWRQTTTNIDIYCNFTTSKHGRYLQNIKLIALNFSNLILLNKLPYNIRLDTWKHIGSCFPRILFYMQNNDPNHYHCNRLNNNRDSIPLYPCTGYVNSEGKLKKMKFTITFFFLFCLSILFIYL